MADIIITGDRFNNTESSTSRKYIDQANTGKVLTVEEGYYGDYDNTYVNGTMPAGNGSSNGNSTITLSSNTAIDIEEGFNAVFVLGDAMAFDNREDGMNGAVSFAWTSQNIALSEGRAIPLYLNSMAYKESTQQFNDPEHGCGGLGTCLWSSKVANPSEHSFLYSGLGFALTLYPKANSNTTNDKTVSHFKLSVKKNMNSTLEDPAYKTDTNYVASIVETDNNMVVYEDDLPEAVDLSEMTSISLSKRDELGYINIYLNGVNIVSFYVDDETMLADMSEAFFTVCLTAGQTSALDLTLYSVNGVLAAFHGQVVGIVENWFNKLVSVSDFSETDYDTVEAIETILDLYPENGPQTADEYDALHHDYEMKNVIENWYDTHVEN